MVEPEDDMAVRENIIEMTLLRIVVHYGLGGACIHVCVHACAFAHGHGVQDISAVPAIIKAIIKAKLSSHSDLILYRFC